MGQSHVDAAYHPRWLRRRVSTYWWLEKPSYFVFILREGSCMFVGWSVLYLILLIRAVAEGDAAYQQFASWSTTPWVVLVNIVAFAFLVFHAVTFFQAAPQAMVLHVGRRRVPGSLLRAGHYVAWVAVSLVVYWIVVGA